jgi:hypothetical protein
MYAPFVQEWVKVSQYAAGFFFQIATNSYELQIMLEANEIIEYV